MKASLQERISPGAQGPNSATYSDADVSNKNEVQDSTAKEKVDFKALLENSNEGVKQQREAKKNKDYSDLTQDEFLKKLSEENGPKKEAKNALGKDDFLKLFITQLQHQDPLNPEDGAEMATKLAQFNSLEQMINMNKNLDQLVTSQKNEQTIGFANYIGKNATIKGGRLKLDKGVPSISEFDLAHASGMTKAEVRDKSGKVVWETDLGSLEKGKHRFEWNGKTAAGEAAPDGFYTYQLSAQDIEGKSIPIELSSRAVIKGIDIKSADAKIYSDIGDIKLDDVTAISLPEAVAEKALKKPSANPKATPSAHTVD